MYLDLKWRYRRRVEKFWIWLAYRLPRPLVLWTVVRAAVTAQQQFGGYPGNETYAQMHDAFKDS